jgi:hypothetical protein
MIRILGMFLKRNEAKDDTLSIREDRVQRLLGNHLTSSKDDLVFAEGQASQTDKQTGYVAHNPESGVQEQHGKIVKDHDVGVEESTLGKENGGVEKKDAESEEGSMGNSESDQASGELSSIYLKPGEF